MCGLPFLFRTDPCGWGRLLYHRYDGALTIVLPETEDVRA